MDQSSPSYDNWDSDVRQLRATLASKGLLEPKFELSSFQQRSDGPETDSTEHTVPAEDGDSHEPAPLDAGTEDEDVPFP